MHTNRKGEARICKPFKEPRNRLESILPAYVACRAGTINMVVVPARQAGNRFLGSIKGLQIRAVKRKSAAVPRADSFDLNTTLHDHFKGILVRFQGNAT
jgi:hypothetical protein